MTDIAPNGRGLARVTGWKPARMVLSAYYGPERCYIRHRTGMVAVYRPNAAHRGILYSQPDAAGRRQIVAQSTTLEGAITAGNCMRGGAS